MAVLRRVEEYALERDERLAKLIGREVARTTTKAMSRMLRRG